MPLYLFFPSIQSFLDTGVKRTIDHARENDSLESFDAHLLEVLFLIRYVDEITGNVANLVTLCLDEIDADKVLLRNRIEASLSRLEKETLIGRSGDNYFFLTNEERDINREIKGMELSGGEEARFLGQLIFDDVLGGQRKHRYATNRMDFPYTRVCDQYPVGQREEGGLVVAVVTALDEDYETYDDSKCVLESSQEDGKVLVRLEDDDSLDRELRAYLKTEKYLRTRTDSTLPSTTQRVHRDLADDNRARRERLTHLLGELLSSARHFVAGQRLEIKTSAPQAALGDALDYLVDNTFRKMGWLKTLTENPEREIQTILQSSDLAQQTLALSLPPSNAQALEDLRNHIELSTRHSRSIILNELIHSRYAQRPYGWPHLEVVLLLARLYMYGEIRFVMDAGELERSRVYDAITTASKWRKIRVMQRITARPEEIQKARRLGKDAFGEMGPDGEDALFAFLRDQAERWREQLTSYQTLADTGSYPGGEQISSGLSLLRALLAVKESAPFLERFNERGEELVEFSEDFHDLKHFYEHQRPTWDRLRTAVDKFQLNQWELDRDEDARTALRRAQEILAAPSPYGMVHETEDLLRTVREVNEALLVKSREEVVAKIDAELTEITWAIGSVDEDEALREACLQPLRSLREGVVAQASLAHLAQAEVEALRRKDEALTRLERRVAEAATAQPVAGEVCEPVMKRRRVITVAELTQGKYLESEQAVEEFLAALRRRLEEALADHERIELR